MSYHNESHRGGSHAKGGLGNTKGGTKTGGSTKKGQHTTRTSQSTTRGNQGGHGGHGTQGTRGAQGGHGTQGTRGAQGGQVKTAGGNLQAQDIKSLVRNQGRAIWGGQTWSLKNPSWNDSALQAIISDPKFTVKPAGRPAADGKWTYELRGHGKTLNVTIGH